MAPPPACSPRNLPRAQPPEKGEEIVISGIAGRYPNAENITEFSHKLYNKIDMVDDDERRWRHENAEIPKRSGKVYGLEKFDATFFGVHFKQAHTMDPQGRLLVEHAYEAVLDAGINPKSLRGSRTGVFIGACFGESEKTWFYEKISAGGFGITGCSRAMLANRISYTLGVVGPSYLVDTACSSSMYALDCAFSAIKNGECDAAIVGASNLLLHPYVTLQFARLGVLAPNGFCRPFDNDATGYTRAEAISVAFIQKSKDAKRIYGTVLYSKTNCDGYKEEGITYPSGTMQARLLTEFYRDISIKPETLDYVEAHSTGTVVGDPEECAALDKIFCTNRKKPLPVGSVKSNIGHSESAAGMCSITKVILAMENRLIPPNINFTKNRTGIPSLEENRLKVVSETTKLDGPLVGINSFGFGGGNAHALIRANTKEKINFGIPKDKIPRLVCWAGRTEEACSTIFDQITSKPLDAEFIGLLHNTQSESVSGNVFRSYGLFSQGEEQNAISIQREIQHFTGLKRPVVWVFSGMGSQWPEMGTSLMNIPIFKAAIDKCQKALKPKGINLIEIITSPAKDTYDNIVNSFVGIASIQIGIVDVLKSLGLEPDLVIGHSVGELGCAYADGSFTAEQMVLCAYSRGLASIEKNKMKGSMAAIGLGFRKIRSRLPATIDVACHNGPDSCTISGPPEEIDKFVAQLTNEGIFARAVNCSNIAYHSRYIADLGPRLLQLLTELIPNPKKRSAKWLSSSVPKPKWDLPENQLCSAQYHTNNLLSAVLFEETSALLPANALTIEIAPHGLLQAILKKSMPNGIHIGLTQRGNKDNLNFFLGALGKIYVNGVDVPVERLYPAVEFPVSRGTPMIASLIKWDHSEDWFVTKFEAQRVKSGERRVQINLSDQDHEYVSGHTIDGRILFPATAYLHLVWETFAQMKGYMLTHVNVQFNDIKFLRATTLAKDVSYEFTIMIHSGTGRFEITEGSAAVCTGIIKESEGSTLTKLPPTEPSDYPILPTKDFYKELRLRGYHYNGLFKSVIEARSDGACGRVKWENNWVAFMDCLLQISIVGTDTRALMLPTRIEKLSVDSNFHMAMLATMDPENIILDVTVNKYLNILQAGGVEIKGLSASPVSRRKPPGVPVLETYQFISHLPTPQLSLSNGIRVCVQLVLENYPITKVKTVEVLDEEVIPLIPMFKEALEDLPLITADLMLLTKQDLDLGTIHVEDGKLSTQSNCMFIIKTKCLTQLDFVEKSLTSLSDNGFLVSRESSQLTVNDIIVPQGFQLIALVPTDSNETLLLLQRSRRKQTHNPTIVEITTSDKDYKWLEILRNSIKNGPTVALVEKDKLSGVIGLINCIRREPDGNLVSCVFIDDNRAPPFDFDNQLYKSHMNLGLAINVYRDGQWGSYRHLQLNTNIKPEPTDEHCYSNLLQKGDLSSLTFIRGPLNERLITNSAIIKIKYASLNFRDVMIATGKLSAEVFGSGRLDQECVLGFEYSGINQNGQRVLGMVLSGALGTHVISDPALTWICPDEWNLEEAATVPVVYATVYSALFFQARIQKGKKILIHAGSGGVGLAAIRVSLAYGLDVYTTVSTQEKRNFLLNTFPTLKANQIGNSRDTSFEEMIKIQTKGAGVDYVLNSLAAEKLHASIRCLGVGGKFLEIGKFDLANDTKIGLAEFLKEMSFHAVLVDNLFLASLDAKIALRVIMEKDIVAGIIKPLRTTVFPAAEIENAFRFLASGKHVGKVLLQLRENEFDKYTYPIKVVPRVNCDPDLSYIIPGGLGGFGLELADWLVIRGARKVVLSSSRGVTKPYQAYRIKTFEYYGATIVVSTANISTRSGCEELIKTAIKLGPVGGIFNLAVVLRDCILDNQTPTNFIESLAPKADATAYLDELSRKLCPLLKYFVVFSSVSCGRGNAGQCNYGMANSIMERLMEQRAQLGLPAKAVQWGAVGEVGLVADMQEDKMDMEIGGTLQQRISSCLTELDALLFSNCPVVSSMVVAEKRAGGSGKDSIIETVMNIMSIRDIKSISMDATLSELGMDSLMAVEIKQSLEREYELFLTPQDLRALTFVKLQEYAESREKEGGEHVKLKLASDEALVGIHMLFRNLGDETNSETTILRLKNQNDGLKYNVAVMIIPGIEGVAGTAWDVIATAIKLPAFVLQLTKTIDCTTITEIVDSVIENVKTDVFKAAEYFYLVGYSFGAFVTLEIARILEENGMKGHVILVDASPTFLKRLAYGQMSSEYSDESIQIMLISTIMRNIFPEENSDDLFAKINEIPTWEMRVNKLVELSKDQNSYTEEYIRKMTLGLYNRIKITLAVKNEEIQPIKSSITLIRPTEVSVVDIDEDYELYKYTEGTVNLKFIEGNHITILNNPKLPQIINEMNPALVADKNFTKYIHD